MRKKVTMKDIATKLGLSINAVSLVLNDRAGVSDDTRRLVLKTAEEMGYLEQSERYNKAYSSKNICVMINRLYIRDMHFYSKILLGIEDEAKKNGYDTLLHFLEDNLQVPPCIENNKVSGAIVVGKVEDELVVKLKQYGIPIVLVDNTSLLESTDSILTDNRLGAYKAVTYLVERGYRKIGFFGDLDYSLSVKERYWGYQEAIKHLDEVVSYEDTFVYSGRYSVVKDIERYVLENRTDKIAERIKTVQEMPEVFVCSNDQAAIQVLNAMQLLGYKVPEDIGVMGFDNLDLCNMVVPKLTTVKVSKELMGRKAIRMLLWRFAHKHEPVEKVMMNVEIVERESVR